ncbi:hypothetical protein ACFYW1_14345 [Streptomyces sp. NPDC002669]|uniref:hypothetical protein n=1 Tax=Streptomyces sp. NPDC002669 TaxID=3364658 RepID=UPI0036AA06C9
MRIHRVRTGSSEVRVVRLSPAPARPVLRDDHHWLSMYADREGATRLTAMWSLAARSARSLVYLPIRANPAPRDAIGDGVPVSLGLVLAHHSLQFPIASWKRVRARLGTGRAHTTATPDQDFPDGAAIDHQRWYHRTYRDHLGFDIAAHTLFVVGSPTAFREHGAALRDLTDQAPAHTHRHPGSGHYCVELGSGPWTTARTRGNVPARLHLQYCDTW